MGVTPYFRRYLMIEYYFKKDKESAFAPIALLQEGCWIHVDEATSADLDYICHLTNLEYTDLQDSLDKYEIPRIEKLNHYLLIFARHPIELDIAVGLYTATLTILLTPSYFITISPQKNSLIHSFIAKKNNLSTAQRAHLLIHLFLKISQDFASQIRRVRHNVVIREKEIVNVESEEITTLTRHEEILNQYFANLEPTGVVLAAIASGKYTNLYEEEQELLQDLLLNIKQSEDLCSISIKSIRSVRDSYQIIFTNNLHKTIKLLTGLTIILNIPTMIASIYGMNIELPFARGKHAFGLILISIFISSIIALILFRRKRWL